MVQKQNETKQKTKRNFVKMLLVFICWIFRGFSIEHSQGFLKGLCDYAFIIDLKFSGNPCIFTL